MFGALNMVQNFSGALLSSTVFIGLGLAGLATKNCDAECEDSRSGTSCVDSCFADVIYSQPDSLRLFIRVVIGYWAPFCELMIAFHSWYFPIKGSRLRKLNNVIRQSRGEDIAGDDMADAVSPGGRGRVSQIAAHHASSKMALHLNNDTSTEEWAAKLAHVIDLTQARSGPKSMAVFFECDDRNPPAADICDSSVTTGTTHEGLAIASGNTPCTFVPPVAKIIEQL